MKSTFIPPVLVGIVLLLAPIFAKAGDTVATIQRILMYDSGMLVYVYPTGGVANPPACHGSNGNYYSFSMSRPMAKEYLAGLLAAQARGATVTFWGTERVRINRSPRR